MEMHQQILERAKENWLSAEVIKKQRTAARSTRTSLQKQLRKMSQYLPAEHCSVLADAITLLDKFGDALEIAGRNKLRMEREEEQRRNGREIECREKLSAKFGGSLEDKLWFLWAVNPNDYSISTEHIKNSVRNGYAMSGDITELFGDSITPYRVVIDKEPVADLIADAIPKIEAKISELKSGPKADFMKEIVVPALVAERLRSANAKAKQL